MDEAKDFPGEEGCPDCTGQGEDNEEGMHFRCTLMLGSEVSLFC